MGFAVAVAAASLIVTTSLPALAAGEHDHREAEAHEHGHGTLRMAIEDDHAIVELEVPAFDILGFEHTPSTAEHRDTISEATAKLARPDTLFALPEAAGCVAGQIEIGVGAIGGHLHEHGSDDGHSDKHGHDDHDEAHDEHDESAGTHSEITAYYRLACANTAALTQIDFGWFDAFPNSEELDVVVLSAAGQSAGEVDTDGSVFKIE